jgi:hypothetical protein
LPLPNFILIVPRIEVCHELVLVFIPIKNEGGRAVTSMVVCESCSVAVEKIPYFRSWCSSLFAVCFHLLLVRSSSSPCTVSFSWYQQQLGSHIDVQIDCGLLRPGVGQRQALLLARCLVPVVSISPISASAPGRCLLLNSLTPFLISFFTVPHSSREQVTQPSCSLP